MKLTCILSITVTFLSACSIIEYTGRKGNAFAPKPNKEMAKLAKTDLTTIKNGYGLYMRKCGECHVHLLPKEVNSRDWHIIVPGMAWNAGLGKMEETAIMNNGSPDTTLNISCKKSYTGSHVSSHQTALYYAHGAYFTRSNFCNREIYDLFPNSIC